MDWIVVKVTTTSQGSENVSQILMSMGAQGCAIEDKADYDEIVWASEDDVLIEEDVLEKLADNVTVSAWFSDDYLFSDIYEGILLELHRIANLDIEMDLGALTTKIEGVADQDWTAGWKKHFHSFDVGEKFRVCPSWIEEEKTDRIELSIDPGMAFGTGTHETTSTCIELLEQTVKQGDSVLDVGCGTGILSIASDHLGATNVLAVDRDPLSVRTTELNCRINNTVDIKVQKGDLLEGIEFNADVIVANILADIVIRLNPDAKKHLNKGGSYIVSGIITDREQDVVDALKSSGFKIVKRFLKNKGHFVFKLFESEGTAEFVKVLKSHFKIVKRFSPEATRKQSREFYVICKNYMKNEKN